MVELGWSLSFRRGLAAAATTTICFSSSRLLTNSTLTTRIMAPNSGSSKHLVTLGMFIIDTFEFRTEDGELSGETLAEQVRAQIHESPEIDYLEVRSGEEERIVS